MPSQAERQLGYQMDAHLPQPERIRLRQHRLGRLESESDRNANKTELLYSEAGKLKEVKLPDGRAYELKYGGELISEVEDLNTKHTAKYTYEGENLATVTLPGEASHRWSFKYDGSHHTEMTDGREGKTKNEYTSNKVTRQEPDQDRSGGRSANWLSTSTPA